MFLYDTKTIRRDEFLKLARYVNDSIIEKLDNDNTKIIFDSVVDLYIDELEIALFGKRKEGKK